MQTKLKRTRHSVYSLNIHLVFVVKFRRQVFTHDMLNAMELIFKNVCADLGCELVEFNGESDHVHLMLSHPPRLAVSVIVNSLKGVSSRLLRRDFPIIHCYLWNGRLWSPSYFVSSCGGVSLDVLKSYIEQQERPK